MTREGWREAVIEAMARDEAGDPRFLDLIADLLADESEPRQVCEQEQEIESWLQGDLQRRIYGPKAWES